MGQAGAWERSGQLSLILKDFQNLFLRGQADDDHNSVVRWRRTLLDFLEALLSSCRRREKDDSSPWVHFNFEPLRLVINHSCCNWASPAAFQCGLMAEFVRALAKVQSALPVSTPGILHVLLHRLATLSPGKETDGRYGLLVSGLKETLGTCPALPSEILSTLLEDCLRRPSSAVAWSMRAAPLLVRGALSLLTQSPRSLCRAVLPVLVCFVAESECGVPGDSSSSLTAGKSVCETRCSSCVAAGWPRTREESVNVRGSRPLRCATQDTRDIVLQTLLVWVVEAHFRESSALLQASLHRAVFGGIRQALDAASTAAGRVSPPYFPLACRMLLSVAGRVAGDGGSEVVLFFRELCADELQHFLARPEVFMPPRTARRQAVDDAEQEFPAMPMLEGYVGHLCLCRHVTDEVVASHLVWLSHQALAVSRKLNDLKHADIRVGRTKSSRGTAGLLKSLCRALALLLCRRQRDGGGDAPVPADAGNLLEIIFDSDARPLASLPRPLASAAVDALRKSGFMLLFRSGALFRSSIPRSSGKGQIDAEKSNDTVEGHSSTNGVDFCAADFAFRRSWLVTANGVDQYLPQSFKDSNDEGSSADDEGCESNGEDWDRESCDSASVPGDYCVRLPDEVTVRVFSFMTPKRLSRLACVNRSWRELFRVDWIWRPFFETRWPLKTLTSEADLLPGVSKMVLEGVDCSGDGKRKNKRKRRFVVHWETPSEHAAPTRNWMSLYRDRHRAELVARKRFARKTNFQWMVCPFLGCLSLLKSEFAVKRHIQTHKPKVRRRVRAKRLPARVDSKG